MNITVFLGQKSCGLQFDQKNNSVITSFKEYYNNSDKEIILYDNKICRIIFIELLDNISKDFDFDVMILYLNKGIDFFTDLHLSNKIIVKITKWIKTYGKNSYTWNNLTNKPDYNLELYKNRYWPYLKVNDKNWQSIADEVKSEYPNQLDNLSHDTFMSNIKKGTILKSSEVLEELELSKDFKDEYNISQKYNNFLGYSVLSPLNYSNINKILKNLNVFHKFKLNRLVFECMIRLLITPDLCHIIKYASFWELINKLCVDNLHKQIFTHYYYYAIYILNHENTIMFSKIKRNYRIIFNHNELLQMSSFNTSHININPYIQQITNNSIENNLPFYLNCKRKFNNVETFENRLFLATGGSLYDIDLSKYNASISGSILIPCVCYSELEDNFKNIRFDTKRNIMPSEIITHADIYKLDTSLYNHNNLYNLNNIDRDFMSYLEYYYPSYYSLNNNDYIKKVLSDIDDPNATKNKKKKDLYNLLSDIDISITCDNYDLFENIANKLALKIINNCKHIGKVWFTKILTATSFKFKLYGPGLLRPIDLFRVSYGPEKMVKKFHCPIVKSWYDGKNIPSFKLKNIKKIDDTISQNIIRVDKIVYEEDNKNSDEPDVHLAVSDKNKTNYYRGYNSLIGCIMTSLSGINNNYKWFFNSKPCVEVILKYAQRGYTTIINDKEKKALLLYMEKSERWNKYTSDDIDIFGQVSKEHIIFKPCINNDGIRFNLRQFKLKCREIQHYSKLTYIGTYNGITEYNINLNIKNNNKVFTPDISKFNSFIEYIESNGNDDFSDED